MRKATQVGIEFIGRDNTKVRISRWDGKKLQEELFSGDIVTIELISNKVLGKLVTSPERIYQLIAKSFRRIGLKFLE